MTTGRPPPTQCLDERCSGTTERVSVAAAFELLRHGIFRSRYCRCSSPSSCSGPSNGRTSCGSWPRCSRTRSGRSADALARLGFAAGVSFVRRQTGSNRPTCAGRSRSRTSATRSPSSLDGSVGCSVVGRPPRRRGRRALPRSRACVGSPEAGMPSLAGHPGSGTRGGSHLEPRELLLVRRRSRDLCDRPCRRRRRGRLIRRRSTASTTRPEIQAAPGRRPPR